MPINIIIINRKRQEEDPSQDNTDAVRTVLPAYRQKVEEWIKSTSCQPQQLPEIAKIDNAISVASTISHNGSKALLLVEPWPQVRPLRAISSSSDDAYAAFAKNLSQKLKEHLQELQRQSEGQVPYEQRFAVC